MSQTTPPREAIQKLPVFQTISESYFKVLSSPNMLIKAAAIPYMISLFLAAAAQQFGGSLEVWALVGLLSLVPYTLFGLAWHRFVLLGEEKGAPSLVPQILPRHLRFLGFAALIWLLTEIPSYLMQSVALPMLPDPNVASPDAMPEVDPSVFATVLLLFLALVAVMVIALRLSFVFPAVSVDESYGLADSWRHTRGQGARLVFGVFLLILPVAFLMMMSVSVIMAGSENGTSRFLAHLISMAFSYLGIALSVTFISTAFRHCTGWIPEVEASGPGEI